VPDPGLGSGAAACEGGNFFRRGLVVSHITYHPDITQGTDEWLDLRRGILTASEMKNILTPTLKIASNDKERAHVYEIAAQRISGFVEPGYDGWNMQRGHEDELYARVIYDNQYGGVQEMGFIVNSSLGFPVGYSPDFLVGDDGLAECKSRIQKYQIQTIVSQKPPDEHIIQIQTGLWVSGREWCDYVSYCSGLPMCSIRVYPDAKIIEAIKQAACSFEERVQALESKYVDTLFSSARLVPTERKIINNDL
jgi:hypothetical protein